MQQNVGNVLIWTSVMEGLSAAVILGGVLNDKQIPVL